MGLLFSTTAISCIGANLEPSERHMSTLTGDKEGFLCTLDAEPPEWEIGHQWRYQMDPVVIDVQEDSYSLDATIEFETLTLEVMDMSNEDYYIEFSADITGGFDANINHRVIDLSGEFLNKMFTTSKLRGNMVFRKSDLAIKEINLDLAFTLKIKINDVIPLRVPASIDLNIDFDTPLESMDFPFDVGEYWGNPKITVSFDGEIKSRWLYRINLLDRVLHILDPEISDLLPVIDISDLIEYAGADNSFVIPEETNNFHCIEKLDLSVGANTYQAYKIKIGDYEGSFYYAPSAGMVIKISDLDLQEYIPFLGRFNVQLIDTNFS